MSDFNEAEISRLYVSQILDMGIATIPEKSDFYLLLKSECEDKSHLLAEAGTSSITLIELFDSLSIIARKSISISMAYNEQHVSIALIELIMSFRLPKRNH